MKKIIGFLFIVILISNCSKKGILEYPENGSFGKNILYLNQDTFQQEAFSLTSILSKEMRLKIKISDASNSSAFGLWYFDASKISDWSFQDYNNNTQYFESKINATECDMQIFFYKGKYRIQYFINNSEEAKYEKTFTVI